MKGKGPTATTTEKERRAIRQRIAALVAEVEADGWTVEWVRFCEDTETPGWLGMKAGICLPGRKAIKIRTYKMTLRQRLSVLEHEIEHKNGAEWATDYEILGLRCGGRVNGWGDPVGRPRDDLEQR